jgi:Zn-dependent peptidase ImmA (M78 family)
VERISVGGHKYSDPDVVSLIKSGPDVLDPRTEVIRRAQELNDQLRGYGAIDHPRERVEILASLVGIKVSPMAGGFLGGREALLYRNADGIAQVYYDPGYPPGRVNFSIAHEIIHTFFPNSRGGARFRNLHADDSREANELERLCDLGAAELLMPVQEFREARAGEMGLHLVPTLSERFGSSFEATVFRLATAYEGMAIAGLLRYRFKKEEQRCIAERLQQFLFPAMNSLETPAFVPKYRRQSLYLSFNCGADHLIPWNKSFAEESCVYRAARTQMIERARERLPNRASRLGHLEAIRAPYQRPDADSDHGDVLFLWWQ